MSPRRIRATSATPSPPPGTSAKLTDVPGHTRGVIGPFAEEGITLLHIGTNPGCGVCTLPGAFRWRDAEGREIYVVYQTVYGKLLELPDGNAYLMSVANDNLGEIRLEGGATVETLDAPLLAPGVRDLLWTHRNPLPNVGEPFHVNLYNDIWDCNFPMWFGDNMSYRFTVEG